MLETTVRKGRLRGLFAWKIPVERNKHFCGFVMKKGNQGQLLITWRDIVWRDLEPMK